MEVEGDFTRWCQLGGMLNFFAFHGAFRLIGFILRQFKIAWSVQFRPYNAITFSSSISVFVSVIHGIVDLIILIQCNLDCWGVMHITMFVGNKAIIH